MIPQFASFNNLKYNYCLPHLFFNCFSVDVEQSGTDIEVEKAGQVAATKKHQLKKLSDDPSVSTPSKPTEDNIKKRLVNGSFIHIPKQFKL